jgi:hypothetical protein
MKTKAVTSFTAYKAADLLPTAQTIHDRMTANAATFPSPPMSMTSLATLISTYEQKLSDKSSRATNDIDAFNLARKNMEAALHDLGVYVNLVAKGDDGIVQQSGFPSYSFGGGAHPSPSAIPAAPTAVKLRNGKLSGTIGLQFKPDRANSMNVAQVNTGDPNNEAGWKTVLQFGGGRATLTGLTTGSTTWVRVATIGPGGQLGAWSDPAKIVVT